MPKSTRRFASPKPANPDLPFYRHATGRWAKKAEGRIHSFGEIADDPEGQKAPELVLPEAP
jgi:hypothetical protein